MTPLDSAPARDIGALARITPEIQLSALALAKQGKTYDLGMEINEAMPQGDPGAFVPFAFLTRRSPEQTIKRTPFQHSVESIIGTLHTSTHIDAFIHVQTENKTYGGHDVRDIRDDGGWKKFGMETVPPIIGRAVILDVAGALGVEAIEDMVNITVEDIQAAVTRQKVTLKQGDIVLVRTGKIREFTTDRDKFQRGMPGVGPDAALWLYERGMAVLGTDTTGTEVTPWPDPVRTTHRAMLVERGVHLIENVYLDDLAADGISEALFICLPLKITGATGSWVRPIAMI